MRSASGSGRGLSITEWTTVKMAVCADTHSEGYDGSQREGLLLPQKLHPEPQILQQRFHFVLFFLSGPGPQALSLQVPYLTVT
jgi:hypothetical protein